MNEIIEKIKAIYGLDGIVLGYYDKSSIARTGSSVDANNLTLTNADGAFSYTEITKEQKDERSDVMCVIDGVYQEFVKPDSELLQEAKDSKVAQIEANKEAFIYLPVEYNGSTFINSEIASTNLQGAYTFAEEPIEWLDIAGNTVMLTKLQMKDLANIMISHRSSGYFQERDLKALVAACVTIEEVIVDGVVTVEGKTLQQCIDEINNIDITFS